MSTAEMVLAYLCIAGFCLVYDLRVHIPHARLRERAGETPEIPYEVRALAAVFMALCWPLVLLAFCVVAIRLFWRNLRAEIAAERQGAGDDA